MWQIEERYENLHKIAKALKLYGQLTVEQGMVILQMDRDNCLAHFKTAIKQKLAIPDEATNGILINGGGAQVCRKDLKYSLDLLTQLMATNPDIDFYNSLNEIDNEPLTIFFTAADDTFDIMYIPEGKEKVMSNKLKRMAMDTNFLVIIENEGQLPSLDFEGIQAVYVVKDGELAYVEQ